MKCQVVAPLALIVAFGLALSACDSRPAHREIGRVSSPDKALDALIAERKVDATVATPIEVFIVRAGQGVSGEPVFRADEVIRPALKWDAERQLTIQAESARIFLYRNEVEAMEGGAGSVKIRLEIRHLETR